jgi:hypothetical protein
MDSRDLALDRAARRLIAVACGFADINSLDLGDLRFSEVFDAAVAILAANISGASPAKCSRALAFDCKRRGIWILPPIFDEIKNVRRTNGGDA